MGKMLLFNKIRITKTMYRYIVYRNFVDTCFSIKFYPMITSSTSENNLARSINQKIEMEKIFVNVVHFNSEVNEINIS